MTCYRFEKLHFENPVFRRVPTSFLITMEASTRRQAYLEELSRVRPTAEVIVLHNTGFETCAKENVRESHQDLWHANLEIFKETAHIDAPILILEDDVKFTDHLKRYAGDIEEFVLAENVELYNLGCVPVVCGKVSKGNHYRVHLFGAAHAILYSHDVRQRLLFENSRVFHLGLHDLYVSKNCKCFTHKFPCAVQAMPQTVNRRNWLLISKLYLSLWKFTRYDRDGLMFYELQHRMLGFGGVLPSVAVLTAVSTLLVVVCGINKKRRQATRRLLVQPPRPDRLYSP